MGRPRAASRPAVPDAASSSNRAGREGDFHGNGHHAPAEDGVTDRGGDCARVHFVDVERGGEGELHDEDL
eukprot:scaffold21632_cov101-Isochrysis_galbana.AAC.3